MGTPVTTFPSPISSCIMPPGPPGPGPCIIIAPGGGGGGGAGASLCAIANELNPANNNPQNGHVETARRSADFSRLMAFVLNSTQLLASIPRFNTLQFTIRTALTTPS